MDARVITLKKQIKEFALDMLSSLLCIAIGIWFVLPRRDDAALV